MAACPRCDGYGFVCENHKDRPHDGESSREDACGCGGGVPCPDCKDETGWPRWTRDDDSPAHHTPHTGD